MMDVVLQWLERIWDALRGPYVTPLIPIPGIATGDAFDAQDAFVTVGEFEVPVRGTIKTLIFYDYDDEGIAKTLLLYDKNITATASDAALAPSDVDLSAAI